jgi:calcineurin-like phosphoesterase family protein
MSPPVRSDTPQVIPVPRWVISDTHFGHGPILDYCPWRRTWAASLEDHDAALVAAWRERVSPDDWVLHLGDFCLGTEERAVRLRALLPGRVILVRGNHDRSLARMQAAGFDLVHSAVRIESGGQRWFGRHNPAAFSTGEAAAATRLLHGHCHGNPLEAQIHPAIRALAFDCSVDAVRSVAPVPWEAVSGEPESTRQASQPDQSGPRLGGAQMGHGDAMR